MRRPVSALAVLFATVIATAALAQPPPSSNYTAVEATSARPVQLGYYASAHKNTCAPAPIPTIRIIEAPKSGTLMVRRALLTTNKIVGCPSLKTPAQVVFYQAHAGATGSDHVVYEVKDFEGRAGIYDVTVNIKEAPKPPSVPEKQKI
jgi:hypothetical protein